MICIPLDEHVHDTRTLVQVLLLHGAPEPVDDIDGFIENAHQKCLAGVEGTYVQSSPQLQLEMLPAVPYVIQLIRAQLAMGL